MSIHKPPSRYKYLRNADQKKSSDSGAAAGQYLALSLFIMLLAFFMILNGISGFETTKVNPAVDSIAQTFGSKVNFLDKVPDKAAVLDNPQKSIYKGTVYDRLDALFTSQISDFKMDRNDEDGVMRIQMKWDDFQKAIREKGQINALDRDNVRRLKSYFLPTLVALLQDDNAENVMHMNMVLSVDRSPAYDQNNNPSIVQRNISEMAEMANLIEGQGLRKNLMSTMIAKGKPGTVNLYFNQHKIYDPRESLSDFSRTDNKQ